MRDCFVGAILQVALVLHSRSPGRGRRDHPATNEWLEGAVVAEPSGSSAGGNASSVDSINDRSTIDVAVRGLDWRQWARRLPGGWSDRGHRAKARRRVLKRVAPPVRLAGIAVAWP